MKTNFKRLSRRIGHRGAFLLFLSLLDFLYGYGLWVAPAPGISAILPLHTWAIIWIVVGIIILPGAFLKDDRIQYGLAATIKAGWAATWIKLCFFNPTVPRAWISVVLWVAFSALVVIVSTWPESRRRNREEVKVDTIDMPVIKGVPDEDHPV